MNKKKQKSMSKDLRNYRPEYDETHYQIKWDNFLLFRPIYRLMDCTTADSRLFLAIMDCAVKTVDGNNVPLVTNQINSWRWISLKFKLPKAADTVYKCFVRFSSRETEMDDGNKHLLVPRDSHSHSSVGGTSSKTNRKRTSSTRNRLIPAAFYCQFPNAEPFR